MGGDCLQTRGYYYVRSAYSWESAERPDTTGRTYTTTNPPVEPLSLITRGGVGWVCSHASRNQPIFGIRIAVQVSRARKQELDFESHDEEKAGHRPAQ